MRFTYFLAFPFRKLFSLGAIVRGVWCCGCVGVEVLVIAFCVFVDSPPPPSYRCTFVALPFCDVCWFFCVGCVVCLCMCVGGCGGGLSCVCLMVLGVVFCLVVSLVTKRCGIFVKFPCG